MATTSKPDQQAEGLSPAEWIELRDILSKLSPAELAIARRGVIRLGDGMDADECLRLLPAEKAALKARKKR